jgi:hypothetical protein
MTRLTTKTITGSSQKGELSGVAGIDHQLAQPLLAGPGYPRLYVKLGQQRR